MASTLYTYDPAKEEVFGQRPPFFNGTRYAVWKNKMKSFLESLDLHLWFIVEDGLCISNSAGFEVDKNGKVLEQDELIAYRNSRAMAILVNSLGPIERLSVYSCTTAKEVWDTLKKIHDKSDPSQRINELMHSYESFQMSPNESVNDMFSRFTLIVNTLKSLGKHFSEKQILVKFLKSLSLEWSSFVSFIKEEKDPNDFHIEELMELAFVHEMTLLSHKQSNHESSSPSKVVLKCPDSEPYNAESDSSSYESESDLSVSSSSGDDPDERAVYKLFRCFERSLYKKEKSVASSHQSDIQPASNVGSESSSKTESEQNSFVAESVMLPENNSECEQIHPAVVHIAEVAAVFEPYPHPESQQISPVGEINAESANMPQN
jgi:hypothetical protein